MSSTEPKGVPDSSPSLDAPTITCRPTPPSQTECHCHWSPDSSYCSPLLQSRATSLWVCALKVSLPDGSWSISLGRSPLLHLPLPALPQVWELEFSAAHFSQEHTSWRFVCIHHFSPVPWKRTVYFSSLFLLLPRTKSLSHPSISYLEAEPLGIFADAKNHFRGIRCYRAKNWETWNEGKRAHWRVEREDLPFYYNLQWSIHLFNKY